jgi:hypothetical protein
MADTGGSSIEDFFDVVESGDAAARAGRSAEALEIYDFAATLSPGHGLPFTRKASLQFRAAFGAPVAPRADANERPAISMSALGRYGQFGNQLLQYAFLRLYAGEHGLTAQAPDWIGRDLFDRDDPLPQAPLPMLDEAQADFFGSLARETPQVYAGMDIKGYFCAGMERWGPRSEAFRALFTPGRKLRPLLDRAMDELRRRGRTLVGVHIRRRNYGYGRFWVAPERWYADWLGTLLPRLDAPVLYVATDDPLARESFARFSPLGTAELGVSIPGADFFLDHYVLSRAEHLAISNSSFSFTAALLNKRAAGFVRPDPLRRALVAFEPWRSPVLVDAPRGELRAGAQGAAILPFLQPDDCVVHVGDFCSAWTNAVRAARPHLVVTEVDSETPIDSLWERGAFETIDHLVIGEGCDVQTAIEGGRDSLDFGRIGAVHYSCAGPAAEAAARALRESGFTVRSLEPGHYMATQR